MCSEVPGPKLEYFLGNTARQFTYPEIMISKVNQSINSFVPSATSTPKGPPRTAAKNIPYNHLPQLTTPTVTIVPSYNHNPLQNRGLIRDNPVFPTTTNITTERTNLPSLGTNAKGIPALSALYPKTVLQRARPTIYVPLKVVSSSDEENMPEMRKSAPCTKPRSYSLTLKGQCKTKPLGKSKSGESPTPLRVISSSEDENILGAHIAATQVKRRYTLSSKVNGMRSKPKTPGRPKTTANAKVAPVKSSVDLKPIEVGGIYAGLMAELTKSDMTPDIKVLSWLEDVEKSKEEGWEGASDTEDDLFTSRRVTAPVLPPPTLTRGSAGKRSKRGAGSKAAAVSGPSGAAPGKTAALSLAASPRRKTGRATPGKAGAPKVAAEASDVAAPVVTPGKQSAPAKASAKKRARKAVSDKPITSTRITRNSKRQILPPIPTPTPAKKRTRATKKEKAEGTVTKRGRGAKRVKEEPSDVEAVDPPPGSPVASVAKEEEEGEKLEMRASPRRKREVPVNDEVAVKTKKKKPTTKRKQGPNQDGASGSTEIDKDVCQVPTTDIEEKMTSNHLGDSSLEVRPGHFELEKVNAWLPISGQEGVFYARCKRTLSTSHGYMRITPGSVLCKSSICHQVFNVLSGKCKVDIDGESWTGTGGHFIFIPVEMGFRIENTSDDDVLYLTYCKVAV